MIAVDPDTPMGSNPTAGAGWAWLGPVVLLAVLAVWLGPLVPGWAETAARAYVAHRERTALDRRARAEGRRREVRRDW